MYNNACIPTCPDPYWENPDNNECNRCNDRCSICGSSREFTDCTECEAAFFLLLSQTSCLTECPEGYWENDPANLCDDCDSTCLTCGTSATDCLSCTGNRFLQYDPATSSSVHECVLAENCHSNTYAHIVSKTCKPCSSSCLTCFGALDTQCDSCQTSFFLLSTSCLLECVIFSFFIQKPDNYYKEDSGLNANTCQPCPAGCLTCQNIGVSVDCLSCSNGYYLNTLSDPKSCVTLKSQCPSDTYLNGPPENKCSKCAPACLVCTGPTTNTCSSCAVDVGPAQTDYYYLSSQSLCTDVCPAGYLPDSSSTPYICTPCVGCATCGPLVTDCLTCNPGKFKHPEDPTCIDDCTLLTLSIGYWNDITNKKCQPCATACATCF